MRLKKFSQCLVMMTACLLVAVPGHAGMISTADMVSDVSGLEFGNIAAQRDWIREQLVLGGVDHADAAMRVDALTDAQVAQLHQRIDEEAAGGNILLIAIIILLISEFAGWTDVIKPIRPIE